MGTEGGLVDLTKVTTSKRVHESVVDLTAEEDEEIQIVQPNKRQKQTTIDLARQTTLPPISNITNTTEKRLVQFKNTPSKAFKDRLAKALTHRIALIQQKPFQSDSLQREYILIGDNGNVYTTVISNKPSCNCEDNKNGENRTNCEHIIFVFLKVFKLCQNDPLLFQKALLNTELAVLFNSYLISPSILAEPSVIEKYLEITGTERSKKLQKKQVKQKPIDTECPVCREKMSSSDDIVFCRYGCGNNIHRNCFDQWKKSKYEVTQEVKCMFCRSRWDRESLKEAHMKNGYLNLADYQDTASIRDFPSYLLLLPELLRRLPWRPRDSMGPLFERSSQTPPPFPPVVYFDNDDESEDEDFYDEDESDEDDFGSGTESQ